MAACPKELATVSWHGADITLTPELARLVSTARALGEEAKAPATRRAYKHGWADYRVWCNAHGLASAPSSPQQIALYVAWLVSETSARTGRILSWSSIQRRLAAIGHNLLLARGSAGAPDDEPLPTKHAVVREVLKGARRRVGVANKGAPALSVPQLLAIVSALPDSLEGRRDRAMLLLGFGGAFRRSEIAAIAIEHLTWSENGVMVFVPRSKTDKDGVGASVPILYGINVETCPVRSLRGWIDAAGITNGPVFRAVRGDRVSRRGIDYEGRMVARVLQRAAARAGVVSPVGKRGFSAHSLRAGFVTAAAKEGEPEWAIRRITRHEDPASLDVYIRDVNMFDHHPGKRLGL